MRETIEGLCEEFRPRAEQKGLSLQCATDADVAAWLIGDPLRLRQVITNLLNNAIKFTLRGGIRLHVKADTDTANRGRLTFSVADTGIGIPADQQRAIFDSFTQVDSSPSRRHQGAGLGLAIASSLVKMMGGTIRVSSTLGEGSEFCFDAQFGVVEDAGRDRGKAAAGRSGSANDGVEPLRILVAEDHKHNRLLIVRTLEARGHSVVEATHGGEAVEAWEREPFDVVLMDCQMPEVTGEEATAAIRRRERETGGHVPIVALTAHAMSDERRHFMQVGMDEYVAKPFQMETLINTVEQVARIHREKSGRVSGKPSGE